MAIISPQREQEIKEIARVWHNKSLADIARENKIFFTESDLSTISWWVSGLIMYNSTREEFGIFIEETNHPNRKRFTFAHELGHYFLHGNLLKGQSKVFIDKEDNFALFKQDWEYVKDEDKELEAEANCFAAELLMPEEFVKTAYKELNYSIKTLSEFFRVSEQAMTYRLLNLKLLSKEWA